MGGRLKRATAVLVVSLVTKCADLGLPTPPERKGVWFGKKPYKVYVSVSRVLTGTTMRKPNGPERRQWQRHAGQIPQLLMTAEEAISQEAVVLDESLSGISILVREGADLHRGQEVRLTEGQRSTPAIVRHVQRREDGKYHLRLECGPCDVKPAAPLFLMPQPGNPVS